MNSKGLGFALVLLFILPLVSLAQQVASLTNFLKSGIMLNPAIAGSDKKISLFLYHRKDLKQIENTPTVFHANTHSALSVPSIGIGGKITHEQAGPLSILKFATDVSYKIHFKTGFLAAGISTGLRQINIRNSVLSPQHINDPELVEDTYTQTIPDIGAGLYYHSKRLLFSLSALQINKGNASLYNIDFVPHYYFFSSYKVNDNYIYFTPSIFVKATKYNPPQFDLVLYANTPEVTAGIGFKTKTIASFQLMFNLKELLPIMNEEISLGYSYDINLSPALSRGNGSNEIFLKYLFKFYKRSKHIDNKQSIPPSAIP